MVIMYADTFRGGRVQATLGRDQGVRVYFPPASAWKMCPKGPITRAPVADNVTAFDAEEWQPELKMDFFLSARQELRLKLQWVGIKAFEDRFYEIPDTPGDLVEIDKPDAEADDFTISSMNFQVRYRWQIAPLSDLFVVYTRNGYQDPQRASFQELFENAWNDPLGEQLVVKLRYRVGS